ncbi:M56 family metallopeptidase [Paenibacillus hamazuiensis]|uniref:M56 family metallopeptidase n=1 Tax=Paenibacillus hamazuiensis TaxID=2936508 RepID=UPI0020109697|nr:M56 family metallopeptidase [Paenibacillus hamazuiensis]
MNWERRSKLLFLTTASVATVIVMEMILYVCQSLYGRPLAYNLFQHCSSWLKSSGLGWMVPALDLLVVSTLVLAFWHIMQQLYRSLRAHRKLSRLVHKELTASLNETFCGGRREVLVVEHRDTAALTMGLIRPKIMLSTGLLDILHDDELAAVIRHEIFHKQSRDPLKTAFMHVCSAVLWYIPILRWCCTQYQMAREVLADAYAIRSTGSPTSLGSALVKLIKHNQIRKYSFTYASFAETSINYRLQQLLEPETKLVFKLPVKRVVVSLHMAVSVTVMLFAELLLA